MRKIDDAYMKLDTVATCFYALEKFIDDATTEKTLEATNRLENFFYLLWEQVKEAQKDLSEAARMSSKETADTIKKLEAENESLKKKLSEFPYA